MGSEDHLLSYSHQLEFLYDPFLRNTIIHNESHNIPSVRTNTYNDIRDWINKYHVI